jgi:hypothetical protein
MLKLRAQFLEPVFNENNFSTFPLFPHSATWTLALFRTHPRAFPQLSTSPQPSSQQQGCISPFEGKLKSTAVDVVVVMKLFVEIHFAVPTPGPKTPRLAPQKKSSVPLTFHRQNALDRLSPFPKSE